MDDNYISRKWGAYKPFYYNTYLEVTGKKIQTNIIIRIHTIVII